MVRLVAATCALSVLVGAICSAQDADVKSASKIRLLVLRNGRVVSGQITPRAGGYDVRKGVGRMYIASETVRFEADDLEDAYRKFRGTFSELTPSVHLTIARWCMANHQVRAARQELLDALHLEPNNSDARMMLKRLELQVEAAKKPAPSKSIAQRRLDQFERSEHESLGGLTSEQAAAFVSRVQPILERRCGNSGCHGSKSPTPFVLKRTRGHSSRLVAERNLATVLRQVDLRNPRRSPLLQAIDSPHTRDGRPVLPGASGAIQRKILIAWVDDVAGTEAPAPVAMSVSKDTKASDQPQPVDGLRDLTQRDRKLLQEARRSNASDPFDPAAFNRIHHGLQQRPTVVKQRERSGTDGDPR